MPIIDLYKHSESRKNLAHFAAMASLAAVDGEINPQEKQILDRFAPKAGDLKSRIQGGHEEGEQISHRNTS